jgi:hypothetical protein
MAQTPTPARFNITGSGYPIVLSGSIDTGGTFTVADCKSLSTSENVTISQSPSLTIQDCKSLSISGNVTLVQASGILVIDDCKSLSSSENVIISLMPSFTIQDCKSLSYAYTLTLSLSSITIPDINGGAGGIPKKLDGSYGGVIKQLINGVWTIS